MMALWHSLLDQGLAPALALLIGAHGHWAYLLLFAIVFGEIGVAPLFVLPGDPLLFFCGAFCASGALDIRVLLPLLALACWLGHLLAYGTGRWLGQRALQQRWLNAAALGRAQGFFAGHGGRSLLVTPYVAVLRTFAPLAAGVAAMQAPRFAMLSAAGSLLWSGGLLGLGYFFGHIPWLQAHLGSLVLLGLALGLGGLALKRRRG